MALRCRLRLSLLNDSISSAMPITALRRGMTSWRRKAGLCASFCATVHSNTGSKPSQ
jgi:hypothetical protein